MIIDDIVSKINESQSNILAMTFCPCAPVSTNDMYIPVSKGKNTRRAYYMKSNELKSYQEFLFKEMTNKYQSKIVEFLQNVISFDDSLSFGFDVKFLIGMNDMNYKRKSIQNDIRPYDVSNYIKSTEDILATRLGIDDKYNMKVSAFKYKSDEESWRVTIIVKELKHSTCNQDKALTILEEFLHK